MVMYAKAKFGEPMDFEEYQQVMYGMCLWMLQENAGLTFKEARVYMADDRVESTEDLAKALHVTKQGIYNLASAAKAKMDKFEDFEPIFKGYYPLVVDYNPRRKNNGPLF